MAVVVLDAYTHARTFDEEQLQDVQDEKQREESVAVHVEGIAPLNALIHKLRHGRALQIPVREEPAGDNACSGNITPTASYIR